MLTRRYASAQDLDGVIDLERLRSGPPASLERDAARFLELTWPSSDVHAFVRGLSRRFNGGSQAGTILAHSAKGLGKSHALLLGYHLFRALGPPAGGQERSATTGRRPVTRCRWSGS